MISTSVSQPLPKASKTGNAISSTATVASNANRGDDDDAETIMNELLHESIIVI